MTNQHPITPPLELLDQWANEYWGEGNYGIANGEMEIATQAARWGADQQLEMDAGWVQLQMSNQMSAKRLIAEMRPKPPSLKEQALIALSNSVEWREFPKEYEIISTALEALPND